MILTGLIAFILSITAISLHTPANAEFAGGSGAGRYVRGVGAESANGFFLGAYEAPANVEREYPAFCIHMWRANQTPSDQVSVATLSEDPGDIGQPGDQRLTTAQTAYLLNKYQMDATANVRAALSYLIHINFEQPQAGRDTRASVTQLADAVRTQLPDVYALASAYTAEARNSGAQSYSKGASTGSGQRTGTVNNIGAKSANGNWLHGIPFTVTLTGPAVFAETGTKTFSGVTQTWPITLNWRATGNGAVFYQSSYQAIQRSAVSVFNGGTATQSTISVGNRGFDFDPVFIENTAPAWDVLSDFQPQGTSNVGSSKVSDTGTVSDTLDAQPLASYGDGQWASVGGSFVPVSYTATAYHTGLTPPTTADTVPSGAKVVGSTQVVANGPGPISASFESVDPGFVTWVWTVDKAKQGSNAQYIRANWSDRWGLQDETTTVRHLPVFDSALSIRTTQSGTYLVDDLFVTGLPEDHPTFTGALGFGADTPTFTQRLYFFPKGQPVTDANIGNAELIGEVTDLPAKNGFYPSVGSTIFKMKGANVEGTYVFQTSFAGDDRTQPVTTSVTDKHEQYTVTLSPFQPSITTKATDIASGTQVVSTLPDPRGAGTKIQVRDTVKYKDLVLGKPYELVGSLVDAKTREPIMDGEAPVTAAIDFRPIENEGQVAVTFDVDPQALAGKTVVVYQRLYRDGALVAVHTDPTNVDQMLWFPTMDTFASAGGSQIVPTGQVGEGHQSTSVELLDRVAYRALMPGVAYELRTTAMDAHTGEAIAELASTTTFTPQAPDGSAMARIPVADTRPWAGRTIVFFEEIALNGRVVARHHDLQDANQTLWLPAVSTQARDQADGDQILSPTGVQTIVDTVSYAGLMPGREYRLVASLMFADVDVEATEDSPVDSEVPAQPVDPVGLRVMDGDEPVAGELVFTPTSSAGQVMVEIPVRGEAIANRRVVVFEDLFVDGRMVASHRDPGDVEQSMWAPVVRTQATPSAYVGEEVFDTAFVGGPVPEGTTLAFAAYRSTGESPVCEASNLVFSTEFGEIDGEGEYRSEATRFAEAGTYYWVEVLTDAQGREVHRGQCGEPSETTLITVDPNSGSGNSGASGSLGKTGSPVMWVGGAALLLALMGVGAIAVSKRRPSPRH